MIVYCCSDLLFASKIATTADALKVPSRPARDAQALDHRLRQVDDGKLHEPIKGVLVDLELGQVALGMITQVKQFDAKIPVVAFGSHVATDMLQAAQQRGADYVMPRSSFTANLVTIVQRLA